MVKAEPYECPSCPDGQSKGIISSSSMFCLACGASGPAIQTTSAVDPRQHPEFVLFYDTDASQSNNTNSNQGYRSNDPTYSTTTANVGNSYQGYYTTPANPGNNSQSYYAAAANASNSNQGYNTTANFGNNNQGYYATTANAGTYNQGYYTTNSNATAGNNTQSSQANSQYYYQYPPNTQGYYLDAAGNRIYYRQ